MGSLISRSSYQRTEKKIKVKNDKGERGRHPLNLSFESDIYLAHNGTENGDPNIDLVDTYDEWYGIYDHQHATKMNVDPPGAPSTYPTKYPITQNDMMSQSRSSPQDPNKSFYQINSFPITTSSNNPYDPNQYVHAQLRNQYNNSPQTVVPEDRPTKKVQFASSHQQTPVLKPLTSTQSWNEPSATINGTPTPTAKHTASSTKSSVHRSVAVIPNTSSAPAPVPKPIYVGIDHKATLAERGQTIATKRHRQNGDNTNSDGSNSMLHNHRTRSHIRHHRKHQELTNSPSPILNIAPSKSFDSLQVKPTSSQRQITTSISTNKISHNQDQIPFISNQINPSKSRYNRQQQSLINNEIKPSKNHSQHRRDHQRRSQTESPRRTESALGQIVNRNPNTPIMRIPISSQQRHKQPIVVTTTANVSRTRI